MGKQKRGNKKKKSRGGGSGNQLLASLPSRDGASDDRIVEHQSSENENVAVLMGSEEAKSACPDEEYVRLLNSLPQSIGPAPDESSSGKEAVDYMMSFLDASADLARDNPGFADRMIGDFFRMAEACKHECWICLSNEADESGREPVRDCSCRGDGLGYVHVNCVKDYARRASLDTNNSLSDKLLPLDEQNPPRRFNVHWEKCSICCQPYQHKLAKELADTLLEFIAEQFGEGPLITSYKIPTLSGYGDEMYINACIMKIAAITTMDYHSPELCKEGEETARKMLAMAYSHDPNPLNIALGLKKVGFFLGARKETYKEGIKFYEKAIEQYESVGRVSSIAIAKSNIDKICIEYEGKSRLSEEEQLKNEYDSYNYFMTCEGYGEESLMGIKASLRYTEILTKLGHGIEGERLATKTVAIASRIFGQRHDLTRKAREILTKCKGRKVKLLDEGENVTEDSMNAVALGYEYEDNRRKLVVRTIEGQLAKGPPSLAILWNGTPVRCHFKKGSESSHLNGKIGDARNYNQDNKTYTIHFEDKSLEPVAVKGGNLSILFELPPMAP